MPENGDDLKKRELVKASLTGRAQTPIDGTIVRYEAFASELIRPRPVDVWLPEGYDGGSGRYPVIYMHDGQFNFHVSQSPFAGMDLFWDVDKAITRLVRDGEIRPAIVVSVWMSHWTKGARGAEYMPQKPISTGRAPVYTGSTSIMARRPATQCMNRIKTRWMTCCGGTATSKVRTGSHVVLKAQITRRKPGVSGCTYP